jgi:phage terminase large subunit-like protein
MTSPTQPNPTAAPQPPTIRVHFELHESPNGDGEQWVKCQIQHGAATFAFVASPGQAEQLAPILGNGFAQGRGRGPPRIPRPHRGQPGAGRPANERGTPDVNGNGVFPRWWDADPQTFDVGDLYDQIPDDADGTWRRKATWGDPLLFALIYLRQHLTDADGNITFADPHFDWCRRAWWWVEKPEGLGQERDAYVAPRDTGKSTWWFLILPMWAAAHQHVRFIAAFADTATQAQTHLRTFRHELDTNELLQADFPDLCTRTRRQLGGYDAAGTVDNQSMLVTQSAFAFVARGIDSSNLGMKIGRRRPDLLLLDDIEPDEAEYSEDLALKRLRTVIDAILPMNLRARVVLVGTVTMSGSIVHQLVRSVTDPDDDPAGWIREEHFRAHYYPPIVTGDDGAERSTWPAKWPYEYLVSIRHTRSYAKNFENRPMADDAGWWRPEDIQYASLPGYDRTVLLVDGAVTVKKTSDYTGLSVVGLDIRGRRFFVREAIQVRLSGEELRAKVLGLVVDFEADYVLVEANQGGDLWFTVLHDLPVKVATFTQREPKQYRIKRLLSAYQYAGGAVFHEQVLPQLERQALAYPNVVHEDVLDATAAAVEHLLWILLQKLGVAGKQASVQQLRRSG